ncbi:LacI family DNA-binding transcriptional regulator [Paraburkholderia pallida]|uniref:LacI family transcriptional regulator n=1 Tax=Paraburkholderia pallida TaxID=2547399 RepID=A0A4P7D5W0_9BURK|nr:LacI family DNA-binding transcriptional regulator [Paraburkholderia pallida]QBR01982.1 LacI family transcriptional regulator [Paraburkholderia pallida]
MTTKSDTRTVTRVTIREVAAAASVNASTVSRVLNPATRHLIGDEVVRRVLAAAKTLGYRQNRLAAALRGGQSRVIGVCLPDIENPVFPPIVCGITEALAAEGYGVLIANIVGKVKDQERLIEQMLERRVDGLVLATAARQDPLVRRCILDGVPLVLVNRGEDGGQVPEVVNDDFLSMRLAVAHLVGLGHTRIAHLAGPQRIATGLSRLQGFQIAAQQHGVAGSVVAEAAEFTREAGRAACEQLLDAHRDVTAIVAANDLIALGCYEVFAARRIACPGAISVIGHNDMPLLDMLNPPLTTLRIQHREMGRQAARLLLGRIATPSAAPLRITLAPELVIRGSTAAARAVSRKAAGVGAA